MALYRGSPVVLSQTMVVSLWLVMPIALISSKAIDKFLPRSTVTCSIWQCKHLLSWNVQLRYIHCWYIIFDIVTSTDDIEHAYILILVVLFRYLEALNKSKKTHLDYCHFLSINWHKFNELSIINKWVRENM